MVRTFVAMLSVFAVTSLAGCQKPAEEAPAPAVPAAGSSAVKPDAHGHEHAHPSEGPHHGQLIELGNEEYHAEIVHDEDAPSVTIYLLDSAAKEPVAIEADELTINLKHNGEPQQFKLSASPQETDAAGSSSRFTSSEPELGSALEGEDAGARLLVKIDGKSYSGTIDHHHEGHEH